MIGKLVSLFVIVTAMAEEGVRPGVITKDDLAEYSSLTGRRKRIVDEALELAAKDIWLKYTFGSADPETGGLDCSGSIYYIFREAGLDPPRSSAAQYVWVKEADALTRIGPSTTTLDSAELDELRPGDLLFWTGTYEPTDGRKVPVSHVQIYLGHEKATGKPVMAGASDGRSYRGIKRTGYGIFDFKLPRPGSKGVFLGYGLPDSAP